MIIALKYSNTYKRNFTVYISTPYKGNFNHFNHLDFIMQVSYT